MASLIRSEKRRPIRVTELGASRMLLGILAVGAGIYLATSTTGYLALTGESIADYGSQESLALWSVVMGSIVIIQGVAGIIVALGIFSGKKWAWTANMVLSIFLILATSLAIAYGDFMSAAGLISNLIILALAFTRPVREYFGERSFPLPSTSPSTISV